jgi:hypothetical protein
MVEKKITTGRSGRQNHPQPVRRILGIGRVTDGQVAEEEPGAGFRKAQEPHEAVADGFEEGCYRVDAQHEQRKDDLQQDAGADQLPANRFAVFGKGIGNPDQDDEAQQPSEVFHVVNDGEK